MIPKYVFNEIIHNNTNSSQLIPINCPFEIKRTFLITHFNKGDQRGFHANINFNEIIICINGSVDFILKDGIHELKFNLNDKELNKYLIIPPKYWIDFFSKEYN
jgi:hypothetical protein